ncbi:MAG TPA: hypothetical protein VFE05_12855 [Longimicrobiaceae bacterium]|jgi:hypothetical protein|nr:hypothetical protein [Longimicrobiaceae bacterium]
MKLARILLALLALSAAATACGKDLTSPSQRRIHQQTVQQDDIYGGYMGSGG